MPKAAEMGQVATSAKMANVGGTCAEICTHIKFPKRNLPIESLMNNASRPGWSFCATIHFSAFSIGDALLVLFK